MEHTHPSRKALLIVGMATIMGLLGIRGTLLFAQMTGVEGATIAVPSVTSAFTESVHASAPAQEPASGVILLIAALLVLLAIYVHTRRVLASNEQRERTTVRQVLCIRIW